MIYRFLHKNRKNGNVKRELTGAALFFYIDERQGYHMGKQNKHNENYDKNQNHDREQEKRDREQHDDERIEKIGQLRLDRNKEKQEIHLLTIIGEIEGHENLNSNSKTTKYEHVLPQLAAIEDSRDVKGVLVLINTMGGDVEAGLAIAEMLASFQTYGVTGTGRQSFYRSADCRQYGFLLCGSHRYHGDSSRAHKRHGYRCSPDL